jgi:hypothetical protein
MLWGVVWQAVELGSGSDENGSVEGEVHMYIFK